MFKNITFLIFALLLTAQLRAGDFPSADLEGLQDRISNKSDTTYVVNFWATWCAPCVKELPYFETLNAQHQNDKVKVLLVSLDFENAIEKRLIPFLKKKKIKSEVIHFNETQPPNYWIPRISTQWSGSIPATLVINGNKGYSKFYEQSFHSVKELEKLVDGVK
ncbi:MAG: TlpA family protein disulfide reductase [Bacteroidetes bacterium]|nr:TlpA family protein disulfide reductase [Bacteroidota bacterium]